MVLGWAALAAASFWFFPLRDDVELAAGLDVFAALLLGAPCDRAKAERIRGMRNAFERLAMRARLAFGEDS
jgi:hypothetical protein